MDQYMKNNLQTSEVNLTAPEFNNAGKENGVNCSDLDKHLNFTTLKEFNESIKAISAQTTTLGS